MRIFVFIILTYFFSFGNTYANPPADLCNYQALLDGAKTDNEKTERETYYLKMLGILDQLNLYRTQFISSGNLINLFPTIYYHTTSLEVEKIRLNTFKYPVEKMRQMLYFFDAYKLNVGFIITSTGVVGLCGVGGILVGIPITFLLHFEKFLQNS